MASFQWALNHKRELLLKELEKIPEYARSSKSAMVELALEEFLLHHLESKNPQTVMDQYDTDLVTAVPNVYEKNVDTWIKFYQRLNDKDYEYLTERLQFMNRMHEQRKLL